MYARTWGFMYRAGCIYLLSFCILAAVGALEFYRDSLMSNDVLLETRVRPFDH